MFGTQSNSFIMQLDFMFIWLILILVCVLLKAIFGSRKKPHFVERFERITKLRVGFNYKFIKKLVHIISCFMMLQAFIEVDSSYKELYSFDIASKILSYLVLIISMGIPVWNTIKHKKISRSSLLLA